MAGRSANHGLIQKAGAALERLAGTSVTVQSARAAIDELGRDRSRTPARAQVVGGPLAQRCAFLDHMAGGGLLDCERSAPDTVIRLRRGVETRFWIAREDGGEEVVRARDPGEPPGEITRTTLVVRRDLLRAEVAARESAVERAELALPAAIRRRPPLWAIWTWLVRVILLLVMRRRIAAAAEAAEALEESRRRLVAAESESAGEAEGNRARRAAFVARLGAALATGAGTGGGRHEVVIEVDRGPLETGIELVISGDGPGPDVDAALAIEGDRVLAYTGATGGALRRLGGFSETATALAGFLADARALRLAMRARGELTAGASLLARAIDRAEDGFRARLERLSAARMRDREAFIAGEIDRMRPAITERSTLVLQQTIGHVEAELDRLARGWSSAVSDTRSGDELHEQAARIDEEAPAAVLEISVEVRRLVGAGLAGGAHDLYPDLVANLAERGLPDPGRTPDVESPPAIEVASTLARALEGKVAGSMPRLQGLFRSLDARRSDVLERIEERRARLRELGVGALLGAEPRLREAVCDSLTVLLSAALDRFDRWLEAQLVAEGQAIERERAALEPLARARDAARKDERDLSASMAQLEASYPPV